MPCSANNALLCMSMAENEIQAMLLLLTHAILKGLADLQGHFEANPAAEVE